MSGRDSEKSSHLSRRNFGVTNRIWIILALILTILLLSRYILSPSPSSSPGGHRLLSSDLKPKNYLNVTELQQPGSPFPFCPAYGEGDEVGRKYGPLVMTKTRLHLGSGARIQRVVNKAMSGSPVTISVIGGSGTFDSGPPRFTPFSRSPPKLLTTLSRLTCKVLHVYGLYMPSESHTFIYTTAFSLEATALTDFARPFSVCLSWCWNGPLVAKLLPVQILPLVEHRLPTPGLRAHKWRNETHQLKLLLVLQFASHTRRDGLDHHRIGLR